ncbi:Ig-like domain-containing protein [Candidatus Palauibacter sp.]|uniref:Ig-like domain-containing protein n=1 Tax=Candidatus Palauibacter sp. TaxID=3101350 RepID=UPI003B0292C8
MTAAGNGTATIIAAAGAVSGSATVSVAQMVSSVTVSPAADTLIQADTLHLSAEAVDSNGHAVAEAEFKWASSDTLVATVDDSGLVTGMAAGEAEITATSSGATGRAQVTVVVPAPTTVTVTTDSVVFTAIGQTGQLSAEVRDQIGLPMVGIAVSWSSSDTTVAAVVSAGLVTAAGIGVTAVTVTVGEVSGAAVVTVEQSAGSVIVSPHADTLAPADTLRLLVEAYDENGHPVESAQFSWSSSDASVATVDAAGLVHGVAEGTATITATAGDARGTAQVTVENPDRAALVALYDATDGPNWVNNENWLTDASLGEWYGVDTNGSGRVIGLNLTGRWDSQSRRYVRHGLAGHSRPNSAISPASRTCFSVATT